MKKIIAFSYLALTVILLSSFKVSPPLVGLFNSESLEFLDSSFMSSPVESTLSVEKMESILNDADLVSDSGLDSAQIRLVADLAYSVGVAANGGKEFIKGVPNPLLHLLTGGLLGLTIHWIKNGIRKRREKKKLLKQ